MRRPEFSLLSAPCDARSVWTDIAQWLAALAAVAALLISVDTSRRQLRFQRESYLILSMQITRPSAEVLIVQTSLENRSVHIKKLSHVFVLIGPYGENPIDTFNVIAQKVGSRAISEFGELQHLALSGDTARDEMARSLTKLSYYTQENTEVADETLFCELPLTASDYDVNRPYSVRLILLGPKRLHRVVHRVLIVTSTPTSTPDPFISELPWTQPTTLGTPPVTPEESRNRLFDLNTSD